MWESKSLLALFCGSLSAYGLSRFPTQGINLIHDCKNAFGGVYGPFFTPENRLVNPPAHLIIDIDPVFEGPLACQYRLHGTIPEGLRPELAQKELEILLDCIRKLQQREPEAMLRAMDKLGINPVEDPATWHWDNYWRLFCVIEGVLDRSVLKSEVENIWRQAHAIVWSDPDHNRLKYTRDFADVSRKPQQTNFPLDAPKTYEFSPLTGYAFVRSDGGRVTLLKVRRPQCLSSSARAVYLQ